MVRHEFLNQKHKSNIVSDGITNHTTYGSNYSYRGRIKIALQIRQKVRLWATAMASGAATDLVNGGAIPPSRQSGLVYVTIYDASRGESGNSNQPTRKAHSTTQLNMNGFSPLRRGGNTPIFIVIKTCGRCIKLRLQRQEDWETGRSYLRLLQS